MCEPVTMGVLTAGLGVAQALGGYAQQQQEADNQNKMYAKNVANAQATFSSEQNVLQQQEVQKNQAQAQDSFTMDTEYQRVRAEQENESASEGQAGLSVESLMADLDRQEADRQAASTQNLTWDALDNMAKRQASASAYVDTVHKVPKAKGPSFGNLATGLVGAGMQGFSSFQSLKTQQSKLASGQ
ncbi:virion core protein, T7 gp14 family [Rhizobium ruizarguesonis]|uniref:virion core protein, T7 gp14 family n=2 Tax=Rhizobium ruizarguesonis TaxID=2081791 RepID=UPI001030EAD9|nr:hypothetical protein [Rhizobium ruizarguesonis]QIJ43060.1 hypothetical protein G7039_24195 [Rhizobium leguminosarum]TAW80161.1 hypothetical protein ELI10_24620 [Rhizobium ruizarguesonis]TAX17123.1 hypothetical protein ELI09_24595 [Rhizobium ruizarguesonis]TAX21950.1 hypothetical protein ELI08_24615 [Rhizobium ruizarguesonis]